MNTEEAEKQLKPYLIGDLTPKEEAILEGHLDVNEAAQWYHQRYYRQTLPILEQPEGEPSEGVLEDLFAKAKKDIKDPEIVVPPMGRLINMEIAKYWKYAAVFLIAIGATVGIFMSSPSTSENAGLATVTNNNTGNSSQEQIKYGEVIRGIPGHGKVLQLGSGVSVRLSEDAEVSFSAQIEKRKDDKTQHNLVANLRSGDIWFEENGDESDNKISAFTVVMPIQGKDHEVGRVVLANVPAAVHFSMPSEDNHEAKNNRIYAYQGAVYSGKKDTQQAFRYNESAAVTKTLESFGSTSGSDTFSAAFLANNVAKQAESLVSTKPILLTRLRRNVDGSVVFTVPDPEGGEDRTIVMRRNEAIEGLGVKGEFIHAVNIRKDDSDFSRVYFSENHLVRFIDVPASAN